MKNDKNDCDHCYHHHRGPLLICLPDGHVVMTCCKCHGSKTVHAEHAGELAGRRNHLGGLPYGGSSPARPPRRWPTGGDGDLVCRPEGRIQHEEGLTLDDDRPRRWPGGRDPSLSVRL